MYIANIVRVSAGKISPFFFVSLYMSVNSWLESIFFSGSLRKFTSGITLLKATSSEERALGTSSSRVTENNCICDVTMT